jgi:hypothetical protein
MRASYIAVLSAALMATTFAGGTASAETKSFKEMMIGAWIVTEVNDVSTTGEKRDTWKGPVKGQIIFGRTGRFMQILVGPTVASMKGDDPRKPDALIVAQYGTYTIDEAGKKINAKIEGASFSPRVSADTTWTVEGSGDKLTLVGSPRKDNVGSFSPKLEVRRP